MRYIRYFYLARSDGTGYHLHDLRRRRLWTRLRLRVVPHRIYGVLAASRDRGSDIWDSVRPCTRKIFFDRGHARGASRPASISHAFGLRRGLDSRGMWTDRGDAESCIGSPSRRRTPWDDHKMREGTDFLRVPTVHEDVEVVRAGTSGSPYTLHQDGTHC